MAYERDSEEDLVWDSEQGEYVPAASEGFTLTISPTPADAIVTLTATGYTQTDNSITVADSTTVSYSVAKSGYTTQYGAVIVTETSTIPITLTIARPIIEESSIGNTVYDIHSKANKNNNTANGADEYVYNWVGTLAEYTTQDIEHTHPDWVCLITDDTSVGEATSNFYTKAEVDTIASSKANIDFTNISATGILNAVSWIMPDMNNVATLSNISTYQQVPSDGFIWFTGTGNGSWADIGVCLSKDGVGDTCLINIPNMYGAAMMVPVSKNTYVKSYGSTNTMRFYACKK